MLEGTTIRKFFGGLRILHDVDFRVDDGAIVSLIGPNGAGKTTLFNIISGLLKPDFGKIMLNSIELTSKSPPDICKFGIGRTFQIVRPFNRLTVCQNVELAALHGSVVVSLKDARKKAMEMLEFVGLAEKTNSLARTLTTVDKKRLEIARALATSPKVLLLDEVMAGLRPGEIQSANELIRTIRKDLGVSIFLIEHVMNVVMEVSDKVIVLDNGEKIAEGSPDAVANDTRVIEAYLGSTAK